MQKTPQDTRSLCQQAFQLADPSSHPCALATSWEMICWCLCFLLVLLFVLQLFALLLLSASQHRLIPTLPFCSALLISPCPLALLWHFGTWHHQCFSGNPACSLLSPRFAPKPSHMYVWRKAGFHTPPCSKKKPKTLHQPQGLLKWFLGVQGEKSFASKNLFGMAALRKELQGFVWFGFCYLFCFSSTASLWGFCLRKNKEIKIVCDTLKKSLYHCKATLLCSQTKQKPLVGRNITFHTPWHCNSWRLEGDSGNIFAIWGIALAREG